MGFWSFVHFNQALLAKQSWRLLDNPTSLLSGLLKSRYLPNNSFFEAPHGHFPSLTWQGILFERELLSAGLRWKIGEGRNINCASEPWIPDHTNFVLTNYRGPAQAVVANLITEDRHWNCHLLHEYFSSLDVDHLLTIPLSYFLTNDKLIWHHHSLGIYNVHSDATMLVRRNIITDSTYSNCCQSWESIGRTLFGCKYARAVWRATNFHFDWNTAGMMHKGDYLIHLTTLHSVNKMEFIICTLWCIWTERNRVVHGQKAKSAAQLASFAKNYLSNYRSAQAKNRPQQNSTPQTSTTTPVIHTPWLPHDYGKLKMNVDATVDSNNNIMGVLIMHAKRTANMTAHSLARYDLGLDEACYWMEFVPPSIYSVIVNDPPV
uniref:Reverse transcriptase zinc-binding domain-containing protein n=1 Tax=Cannabis sativa TaxID=3483 RepID=A0A803P3A8_CANSA